MLASKPLYVPLHCGECGRGVMVRYHPDLLTEQVDMPIWLCPYPKCGSVNELPGASSILSVHPREPAARFYIEISRTRYKPH